MDLAHRRETLSLCQTRSQNDSKADVQAFARQHYGWRGSDNDDHVDHDMIVSTGAQTSPNQKIQPQDPGRPLYSSDPSRNDASDNRSSSGSNESSVNLK